MATDSDSPPTFSVIMPVYNHERFVGEAVRSVIAQRREDWELWIVDDGSTDASGSIVDELAAGDERITVIHQPNAGPAAARNAALDRARGEWLAFLDSDDVWADGALESYAAHIAACPEAQFIRGYRHRMDADGSKVPKKGERQDAAAGTAELFDRMFLEHMCVCYRRELLDRTGRFHEGLRCSEDYELYLRMSLHCRFEPTGVCVGWHRRHGGNISRQSGYTRMVQARILERFAEGPGREVLEPERVARRLGRLYYAAGRQYFKARCYRQALAASALSRRYRPTAKNALIALLSRCLLPLGRRDGRELPEL